MVIFGRIQLENGFVVKFSCGKGGRQAQGSTAGSVRHSHDTHHVKNALTVTFSLVLLLAVVVPNGPCGGLPVCSLSLNLPAPGPPHLRAAIIGPTTNS